MNRLSLTARIPLRPRSRRLRASALAAVGAVVLSGSLAGCQPAQAGAAAIVGNDRLTVSAVQDRVREVIKTREQVGNAAEGDLQRLIVRTYVIGRLIQGLAKQQGVSVSAAQIDEQLGEAASNAEQMAALEKQAAQGGVAKSQIRDVIRMSLLERAVLQKLVGTPQPEAEQLNSVYVPALVKEAERLGVQVNPRYGKWDPEALDITAPAAQPSGK